jgi:aquaporin Z
MIPDRPLVGKPLPHTWHPRLYGAELVGTALLVSAGVSVVIAMFGQGTPMEMLIPNEGARRLLTGFLFGLVGAIITVSPVGRISGAHLNPAVTLAFLAEGKLARRDAVGYVVAQLLGGLVSIAPLRAWGPMGRSVRYGATIPLRGMSVGWPLLGEVGVTCALVALIFVMASHRRTRRFTPWSIAPLFGLMVWLEAPLSGTSANPARSLGPAILAGDVSDLWLYFVGPAAGALLAVALLRARIVGIHRPPAARVAHFHLEDAVPPQSDIDRPPTPVASTARR